MSHQQENNDYFAQRAAQEIASANAADNSCAKAVHEELAKRYARHADLPEAEHAGSATH